ncbi:MAG: CheR family methyltransferase [bacterium]|jgi:chemotaxis protein methyltransferase CheR
MSEIAEQPWCPVRVRPLTPSEFERIRRLAHEKFGLDLKHGKQELVAARLGKILRRSGFRTFGEYYDHVAADRTGEALTALIDALTTNYTSFFREPAHFDFLRRTLIPEWRGRSRVQIWSAGCATGEEPYSIAMCLSEESNGAQLRSVRILASDISTQALKTAHQGVYATERLRDLPPGWLQKYFLQGVGKWSGCCRVRPELRAIVEFRRQNLTEPFSDIPPCDLIFCRNVMIYFDKATQEDLVRRLAGRLEPGGYLFTGHSESLLGGRDCLEYVRPAIYRRPGEPRGRGRKICR